MTVPLRFYVFCTLVIWFFYWLTCDLLLGWPPFSSLLKEFLGVCLCIGLAELVLGGGTGHITTVFFDNKATYQGVAYTFGVPNGGDKGTEMTWGLFVGMIFFYYLISRWFWDNSDMLPLWDHFWSWICCGLIGTPSNVSYMDGYTP